MKLWFIWLLALASPAVAADIPTKAPLRAPLKATCPVGTGFYGGINSYAQAANGSVATSTGASTSVIADGAAIGLTLGYAWGDCLSGRFYGFEGLFDYQNLGGSNPATVVGVPGTPGVLAVSSSISSKWEFTQRFKIGTNLADVMEYIPSFGAIFPGMPVIAPGTNNPKAYVAGVLREADVSATFMQPSGRAWSIEPGLGVGIQSATPNGSVVDVFVDYTFKGAGFTAGLPNGTSANLGGVARAGVQVLW